MDTHWHFVRAAEAVLRGLHLSLEGHIKTSGYIKNDQEFGLHKNYNGTWRRMLVFTGTQTHTRKPQEHMFLGTHSEPLS